MSYILDALRRADAERSRGAVPGVHDPAPRAAADGAEPAARGVPLVWVVILVLLVVVAVLAWQMLRQAPAPRVAAATLPVHSAPPAPVPPPPVAAESPAPQAAPVTPPRLEAPATPRQPAKRAVVKPAQPAPTPAAADAAPQPIVALADLPPQVRSALPRLDVGGSVYSENPASRYLILNGQVFREQSMVTSELRLEEINLRSAVFRFREHRYRIEY